MRPSGILRFLRPTPPTNRGGELNIRFLPESDATLIAPPPGWAVISITDRGRAPADLKAGWCSVYRISFDDVENDWGGRFRCITDAQAHKLVRYLERLRRHGGLDALIVHCFAGASRSAAVAVFAAAYFGVQLSGNTEGLNRGVLRRLRRAALRRCASAPSRFLLRAATCAMPKAAVRRRVG